MQQNFLQQVFLVCVGKDVRSYLTSGIQVIYETDVTDALDTNFLAIIQKSILKNYGAFNGLGAISFALALFLPYLSELLWGRLCSKSLQAWFSLLFN